MDFNISHSEKCLVRFSEYYATALKCSLKVMSIFKHKILNKNAIGFRDTTLICFTYDGGLDSNTSISAIN